MSVIKPLSMDIKTIYGISDYFIINVNATKVNDMMVVEPTAQHIFDTYGWLNSINKAISGQYIEKGIYRCYYPFGLKFSKSKVVLHQLRDWHYSSYENAIFIWSLGWLYNFANNNNGSRFDCFTSPELATYYRQLPNNIYVHIIGDNNA